MKNSKVKSATLLLEVIENEGKTSYLLRVPQNGQLVSVCGTSDELVTFLGELFVKHEDENE